VTRKLGKTGNLVTYAPGYLGALEGAAKFSREQTKHPGSKKPKRRKVKQQGPLSVRCVDLDERGHAVPLAHEHRLI
jgi:hypothetical protein